MLKVLFGSIDCRFNQQFFQRHLKFLIQVYTVSFLFENCHCSVKVPLSCNFMGCILAIKIRGHEFNLPWHNNILWTSVSLSLMLIDWEDCRMKEFISAWVLLRVEKTKFVFQVERAFLYFFSLFLLFSCVSFVYLRSQRILKVTPPVWKRNPKEQAIVNAFAIFIFSAQFNSGTDQSEKPKTPKFTSKSLLTPLVWPYNHLKQVKIPHHLCVKIFLQQLGWKKVT